MGRMQVVLLREWAGRLFLDESWGWVNLPPGGSWGVDVVAVVVIMPRCLGPGDKKQHAKRQIGGIPYAAYGSLVWSLAMIMWVRQNPGAPDST